VPQSPLHPVTIIDFETIYYCFGYPFREVLKHIRKYTKNFPEINIPSDDPICLGCHDLVKQLSYYFILFHFISFFSFTIQKGAQKSVMWSQSHGYIT